MSHFAGSDGVRRGQTRHSRSRHQGFSRIRFEYALHEHGFGLGLVDAFTHNVVIVEQPGDIRLGDPQGLRNHLAIRCDARKGIGKRFGLQNAELGDFVWLPIHGRDIDAIEIDKMQAAHAGTR